jgi:hypothetical protein
MDYQVNYKGKRDLKIGMSLINLISIREIFSRDNHGVTISFYYQLSIRLSNQ